MKRQITAIATFLLVTVLTSYHADASADSCEDVKMSIQVEFAKGSEFNREWKKLKNEATSSSTVERQNEMVRKMDDVMRPALKSFERLIELIDQGLESDCFDDNARPKLIELRQRVVDQLNNAKEKGIPF